MSHFESLDQDLSSSFLDTGAGHRSVWNLSSTVLDNDVRQSPGMVTCRDQAAEQSFWPPGTPDLGVGWRNTDSADALVMSIAIVLALQCRHLWSPGARLGLDHLV